MIKLLVKKTFFDVWDNLLSLVLFNVAVLICFGLTSLVFRISSYRFFIITLILAIVLIQLLVGLFSALIYEMPNYKPSDFDKIIIAFFKTFKASIVFAALNIVIASIIFIALKHYLPMRNIQGGIGTAISTFLFLFWTAASQYFYPILLRMKGGIKKTIKKTIMITIDNILFSIYLVIHSAILLTISAATILIVPGISSVLLLHHDALNLLLHKYDWLEENPERLQERTPWTELLKTEKEKLSNRTLRNIFFSGENEHYK